MTELLLLPPAFHMIDMTALNKMANGGSFSRATAAVTCQQLSITLTAVIAEL